MGKLFVASDGLECRANRPSVLFLFSSRFLIFNTLISITKEKLLYYSSSKSSIISLIRTSELADCRDARPEHTVGTLVAISRETELVVDTPCL